MPLWCLPISCHPNHRLGIARTSCSKTASTIGSPQAIPYHPPHLAAESITPVAPLAGLRRVEASVTSRKWDMTDSSDFTFCQVGLQLKDEQLESHEIVPNISKITLDDNLTEGLNYIRSCNLEITNSNIGGLPHSNGSQMDPVAPKAVEKTGDTRNEVQEQKLPTKKPAARAKVPFEKGYSQMDWLKLTRTHPDLAGLKGQSNRRLISMDEVKQHKTEGSIWTVWKGRVYNISPYMKFHPGGVDMLMKAAGRDCTALFNKYHAWVNAEFLLEKCLVGMLDES